MSNTSNILRLAILFVVVTLAQIFIFNNIQVSGFVNPYLYIVFIMTLPFGIGRGTLLVLSFFTGLFIDLFSNTPGMHACACTLIGYVRPYFLKFIAFRNEYREDGLPSMAEYGLSWYAKYAVLMVCTHHVTLFFIEQFDTLFFWPTLLRIILSIVSTLFFIIILQLFMPISTKSE
ncbi:MAG: rod shape-determining protein MreD [Bacteroidales bacterium]|nr:rod shape-determining protein MreD [Bacteroidales bacterium]